MKFISAERVAELAVVGPGIAHPRETLEQQRPLHLEQLVERGALGHRHVVDLVGRRGIGDRCSQQIHLDRVLDIAEIPAGLAVAEIARLDSQLPDIASAIRERPCTPDGSGWR